MSGKRFKYEATELQLVELKRKLMGFRAPRYRQDDGSAPADFKDLGCTVVSHNGIWRWNRKVHSWERIDV